MYTLLDYTATYNFPTAPRTSNPFADMFPTTRAETGATESNIPAAGQADENTALSMKLHEILSDFQARRVVTDEEAANLMKPVPRPGSNYPRYRHVDQLPENARVFYETAAKMVGISLRTLVKVAYQAEHKIRNSKVNV